jgi:hypothetical protein
VILDFLRDPTMTCPELPSQKEERQAFLREVEYYGLKEVMVGEKKEAELLCEQGYAFYNGNSIRPQTLSASAVLAEPHSTPRHRREEGVQGLPEGGRAVAAGSGAG